MSNPGSNTGQEEKGMRNRKMKRRGAGGALALWAAAFLFLLAAAGPPGANPAAAESPTRSSRAAGIEVTITLLPPAEGSAEEPERLRFRVSMDAHMGDLMQYDLTRLTVLRTGEGVQVESGFVWEPDSESSHHRSGILWLPGRRGGSTGSLELELKGLATASRIFRWTPEEPASVGAKRSM